MSRSILHVDLDQFYAAVECLDDPTLRGLPLIVGGLPGSRGVVCTASYEARKFGVRSAMSSSLAARLCPQAVWRRPRMARYAEKSREVRRIFARFTGQIEPLSLDEAFLDISGSLQLFGSAEEIGRRVKREILSETGLVASVGIAENKFLAKIGSDLRKPDGFVVVPPGEAAARAFLGPLPIARLWGVGPRTAERLEALGLRTIGNIAQADPRWLARRLGAILATHLSELAHGRDDRPVEARARAKSIGKETTFERDLFHPADLERELLACADDVAARLREDAMLAGGVMLKVKFADFRLVTRFVPLEEPLDVAQALHAAAVRLLRERVTLDGQGVRLIGLAAQQLLPAGTGAPVLFPDPRLARSRRAAGAIDRVREKFGGGAITFGRLLEARPRGTGTPAERLPPADDEAP